ncbi:hypothetical protein KOR42_06330 [Thalassoglobus neptunius]|uniref:Tll0287-like domain-containing protein n=1 Tax=Thalassoglobus neptunius TaxID=1938619 RepID=A0A5C5X2C1_9PLAN|nr:DUF3365 domain-containing protein [Thalassoglobus neptunius]TWT57274.1 hypothetical protein KOR42_06330 [Thalassoglobus neptunius]
MAIEKFCWARTISLFALAHFCLAQQCDPMIASSAQAEDVEPAKSAITHKESVHEENVAHARRLASILFESVHGSLQVMHRDLFREDESLSIPSRSLEDVFSVLNRKYNVELRWLAVDTPAMNIDHEPSSEFEKQVVRHLRTQETSFESIEGNRFHYAGRIRLSTTCLGCHVPRRSDNDDRFAGLLMTFDLQRDAENDASGEEE